MKAIDNHLRQFGQKAPGVFTRSAFKLISLVLLRHSYKYFVKYIHSLDELPYILNGLNLVGEGAEIGVKTGIYSRDILTIWRGRKLYSIDPWIEFSKEKYIDSANVDKDQQAEYYSQTCNRLRSFGSRSQILQSTSEEAAHQFDKGQLDFVYIDAQHHYEAVKKDLWLWYPKVRRGGILCGHDFIDGKREQGLFGVKKAVKEFAGSNGLQVLSSDESSWPSWFIFL